MIRKLRNVGLVEKKVKIGEVELNYVKGPDNGPALLLIPAQALSWESYQPVIPELVKDFTVYAIDIRGHGKSSRTPNDYSWNSVGHDLEIFLKDIVGQPAIVSGNSSGGVLCVWLAANAPELVSAIMPEDPPLFSSEFPRMETDRFQLDLFKKSKAIFDQYGKVRVSDIFKVMTSMLTQDTKKMTKIPLIYIKPFLYVIRLHELLFPNSPVNISFFPLPLRLTVKGYSEYDPRFGAAFIDGSFQNGFDHAEALKRVKCPMLLLQANWFRDPELGLMGAMDGNDIPRIRELVPQLQYKKIDCGHVIHQEKPNVFINEVRQFTSKLES